MAAVSKFPTLFWGQDDPSRVYRVRNKIGEGAFSEIYHVTGSDNNEYALKVFKNIEKIWNYVKKEAAQLHKAQGVPHTLKIYKVLVLDNRCFPPEQRSASGRHAILMQLGKGKNLWECALVKGAMRLQIDEIKNIAKQALETLAELMRREMVHADLKPENCLYDKSTQELIIVDFGFSRNEGEGNNEFRGTMWYASPETIMREPASPANDMWSLGALLFELLTGEPLFTTRRDFCDYTKPADHFYIMAQQMGERLPSALIPSKLKNGFFRIEPDGKVAITLKPSKWICEKMQIMSQKFGATSVEQPMWQTRLVEAMKRTDATPNDPYFMINLIGAMLKYNPKDRLDPVDAARGFFHVTEEKTG